VASSLQQSRIGRRLTEEYNPMPTIPQSLSASTMSLVASGLPSENGSATGTISYGAEHDIFPVTLTGGQHYIFDVHGFTLHDPTLRLYNGAGLLGEFNDDGGPGLDSRIEYTPTSSGSYYLDVASYASAYTGSYTVSSRVDDVANDVDTLARTSPDGWSFGNINRSGDHDYYGISLTAGQHYTFDVEGRGLTDPTLAVHRGNSAGGAGAQLAYNDDYGGSLDSHIDYTATYTGMHYLDVGGFGSHTGTYLLIA
jgi:hypothetical protein